MILQKTEGNPFFVEEVIRSLLDTNLVVREDSRWRATREIENIAVPDTLSGVVTARLDRLDEGSKRVAQTAAVIGREFPFDALASVYESRDHLDEALTDLQRRELIREKSRIPQPVYMFKHAMTQETAYASLLLSRRRELHRRVAESMEQIDPERVNHIARHYMEAQEYERALPYLFEAGDRAAHAYSTVDAIGYYRQALQVLESVDDIEVARRVYEGLGGSLTFAFDIPAAVENYHTMFHLAEEHGDLPMQVSALNKLGFVTALMQGQIPEAEKHLIDAERLAFECGDQAGLAELHTTYCYIRTATGDFDGALDHLSEASQIGHDLDMEEPKLLGMVHTANTLIYMTRFEDAWQAIQEARRVAEEAGNRKYLSELLSLTIPLYHIRNGNLDTARESAQEGADIASQIGAMDNESAGAYTLGQISWLKGEYERAIEFQERALQAARASGTPYMQTTILCALGTAYVDISPQLGDKTFEFHTQAMQLLEMPLGTAMGALSWAEMGFCAMTLGELERASELFQKGLTTPSAPMHTVRPKLLVGSAFVAVGAERSRGRIGLRQGGARTCRSQRNEALLPLRYVCRSPGKGGARRNAASFGELRVRRESRARDADAAAGVAGTRRSRADAVSDGSRERSGRQTT